MSLIEDYDNLFYATLEHPTIAELAELHPVTARYENARFLYDPSNKQLCIKRKSEHINLTLGAARHLLLFLYAVFFCSEDKLPLDEDDVLNYMERHYFAANSNYHDFIKDAPDGGPEEPIDLSFQIRPF
jgi:hypothetical protein